MCMIVVKVGLVVKPHKILRTISDCLSPCGHTAKTKGIKNTTLAEVF